MVHFFFQKPVYNLKQRNELKRFLSSIFKREKIKLRSLTYIFCSDDDLLEINKQFLKHNYYTDIITFDMADPGQPVEGEIYISIDRVKDNAGIEGTSMKEELHRVIFHGALHLCGYKDKTQRDEVVMRGKENEYLRGYSK